MVVEATQRSDPTRDLERELWLVAALQVVVAALVELCCRESWFPETKIEMKFLCDVMGHT